MSDKSSFRKVFHSKRGSSVLEYVVIIVAGVLLGSLLLWAINSDDIRSSMDTAVENAINGETGHGDPTSPPSDKEDPESPKDKDIRIKGKLNAEQDDHGQSDQNWLEKGWGYLVGGSNGEAVKPTFISSPPNGYDPDYVTNKNRNHYTNDKVDNNQDDKSLWEKGLDYVLKGWDSPSQAWERVSKDWDKMWDEPGEYWSEQFAWEDIKETWKALTSDFGQYWVDTWDRTVDEVKGAWDAVIDDPVGTGKQLLEDAIGVNDAKAFWNGIDPETGEEISIVDRLIRGVAAFPATKVVKLGDKGLGIAQKIFVRKHDCSCPKKNDKDDDKREETERRNQRKEELDRILDLSHSPRSESRNRRANAHLLEQDLERADFKVEDIGLIWERINHNKAKNMKEVIGEYLAEKEIRQKHGDKYESRPTKINNTGSGIDHVLVSRNADGTIDELIIAETKFNTSQKGDTNDGKQMSEEWIRAKAEQMIDRGKDAGTKETGKMILAALDEESYDGQQLSRNMIDTRYYNVKPTDKNNPQGEWEGTWERDSSSELRNDRIPDDWP